MENLIPTLQSIIQIGDIKSRKRNIDFRKNKIEFRFQFGEINFGKHKDEFRKDKIEFRNIN